VSSLEHVGARDLFSLLELRELKGLSHFDGQRADGDWPWEQVWRWYVEDTNVNGCVEDARLRALPPLSLWVPTPGVSHLLLLKHSQLFMK